MNKAFGKVILIGEHAVVYNEPAIAIPFKSMQVETNIIESDTLEIKVCILGVKLKMYQKFRKY